MSLNRYCSIDNSPTKQRYSFNRAPRFPKISIYGAMSFYNIPSSTNTRATSFGYGSRYDFVPRKENRTPACYDYNYGVESQQPSSPKYSFGIGRGDLKRSYDLSVPGPGKYYCTLKTFGNDGAKYSIKGKYQSYFSRKVNSPGPGAYKPGIEINPNGVFALSKYKNVQSVDFSSGSGSRFEEKKEKSPGPADYKNLDMFGKISDSRYKSTNGISLGGKFKIYSFMSNNTPGPGAYERYGDFYKFGDKSIDSYKESGKKSSEKEEKKESKDVKETDEKKENEEEKKENEDEQKENENTKKESEDEKKEENNNDKVKEENRDGSKKEEEA